WGSSLKTNCCTVPALFSARTAWSGSPGEQKTRKPLVCRGSLSGRYWARTSDLRLVESLGRVSYAGQRARTQVFTGFQATTSASVGRCPSSFARNLREACGKGSGKTDTESRPCRDLRNRS